MKTKITLLIAFTCISFASCIKDFHGHPDDKDGILTETNYFYSEDFKTDFLEIEIANLEVEIKILISQGANENDPKLILAQENLESALAEVEFIATQRDIVFRRRPPLPGPCPKIENCFPLVQYIAVPSGLDFYELVVLNANGEAIGRTEGGPSELGNVGGLIESVVFIFDDEGYEGEAVIQIKERLNPGDETREIRLNTIIGQ